MKRADQRERTRAEIVDAAVSVFAEHGFEGAGTRAIAAQAGVTQGLLTYHFESKEVLWRSAADQVFGWLDEAFVSPEGESTVTSGPDALGTYVRVNAAHPEIFHFMVDVGRHDDDRLAWLIDTHLQQRFEQVADLIGGSPPEDAVHLYYALAGAASLIFAVGPECRGLSGVDPSSPDAIDKHVDVLLRLFGGAMFP
jgi:TetR/AcrR family transcriptional regulator